MMEKTDCDIMIEKRMNRLQNLQNPIDHENYNQ